MEVIKNEGYSTEDVNLFGDCENSLKAIADKRIFNIYYDETSKEFWINEECDQYFGMKLTSQVCKDLSELFHKISGMIEQDQSK